MNSVIKYICFQNRPTTPPHTHTSMKEKKKRHFNARNKFKTEKIPHHKNINKRKNRLTPVKLESKKQDKKVLASRERTSTDPSIPSIVLEEPSAI